MRTILIFITVVSIFLTACGESKKKDKKTYDKEVKAVSLKESKEKTPAEIKEEGNKIRLELNQYDIEIPSELVYKETIVNAMAFKKSIFVAEKVDETMRKELDDWFLMTADDLEKSNWEKEVLQENDMLSGSVFNSYSFKRVQKEQGDVSDMLTITTVFSSNGKYIVYIKPYIVGQVKEKEKAQKQEKTHKAELDKKEKEILRKKKRDSLKRERDRK